jgi:hypothetical protein
LDHDSLYRQFPARSPLNSSSEFSKIQYYDLKIDPGRERTALQQAGFQIVTLIVTLVIAIIGGLVTGENNLAAVLFIVLNIHILCIQLFKV